MLLHQRKEVEFKLLFPWNEATFNCQVIVIQCLFSSISSNGLVLNRFQIFIHFHLKNARIYPLFIFSTKFNSIVSFVKISLFSVVIHLRCNNILSWSGNYVVLQIYAWKPNNHILRHIFNPQLQWVLFSTFRTMF